MADLINNSQLDSQSLHTKLLFVITQSEFGGAQRFLSQLLNHIDLDKFECAVVSSATGSHELKDILPKNVRYIRAQYLKRQPNIISDIASVFELKKIIKDYLPDTLFLISSKAGFNGSLAAKLLPRDLVKPKIIYRIGGWTFNDPWPAWKKYFYRFLEKLSTGWKDYIIVNNKHDYDQAIEYGIKPRRKVVLIHNGIDPYKLDFLEPNEAKIRLFEKLARKSGSFLHEGLTIGTIANLYPTKGIKYLIDGFAMFTKKNPHAGAKLAIIGDGPEKESLELQIKDLALENKVFLLGQMPNAYQYLNAFDIFVLSSVKEGFPWALLEAMSAKLPVIATNVGANPEIIESGKNGLLVEAGKPEKISEALELLISNEAVRREFGIQAHQTVLFKFDLKKMIDQVVALL
jgi:glycosyltransferase involved in cell wall biosynthesis